MAANQKATVPGADGGWEQRCWLPAFGCSQQPAPRLWEEAPALWWQPASLPARGFCAQWGIPEKGSALCPRAKWKCIDGQRTKEPLGRCIFRLSFPKFQFRCYSPLWLPKCLHYVSLLFISFKLAAASPILAHESGQAVHLLLSLFLRFPLMAPMFTSFVALSKPCNALPALQVLGFVGFFFSLSHDPFPNIFYMSQPH